MNKTNAKRGPHFGNLLIEREPNNSHAEGLRAYLFKEPIVHHTIAILKIVSLSFFVKFMIFFVVANFVVLNYCV